VPRYGVDVVGGAETLVRGLAEHLAATGSAVEVLTTCARDHLSWKNVLPAGANRRTGFDTNGLLVDTRPFQPSGCLSRLSDSFENTRNHDRHTCSLSLDEWSRTLSALLILRDRVPLRRQQLACA